MIIVIFFQFLLIATVFRVLPAVAVQIPGGVETIAEVTPTEVSVSKTLESQVQREAKTLTADELTLSGNRNHHQFEISGSSGRKYLVIYENLFPNSDYLKLSQRVIAPSPKLDRKTSSTILETLPSGVSIKQLDIEQFHSPIQGLAASLGTELFGRRVVRRLIKVEKNLLSRRAYDQVFSMPHR